MRLKARLTRLEAELEWVRSDGFLDWCDAMLTIYEHRHELEHDAAALLARLRREEAGESKAGGARQGRSNLRPLSRDHDQEKTRHWSGAPPAMKLEQAPATDPLRTAEDDWQDDDEDDGYDPFAL